MRINLSKSIIVESIIFVKGRRAVWGHSLHCALQVLFPHACESFPRTSHQGPDLPDKAEDTGSTLYWVLDSSSVFLPLEGAFDEAADRNRIMGCEDESS